MKGKRNSVASKHCQEEGAVDRISNLPDNLIHEILSFIDMRYAVQTSVLSKRWKNVWMSLPFITVDFGIYFKEQMAFYKDENDISSFCKNLSRLQNRSASFVNKVFELRDESDIQMINLALVVLDDTLIETLNGWILEAVNHNVQDLTINASYFLESAYEIPHQLVNCRSLKKLNIIFDDASPSEYTHVILPNTMSLPQIKTLWLQGISISDLELQRFISSCPLVEMVLIQKCDIRTSNHRNIIIDSHNLRSFELIDNRHTYLGSADDILTCASKICAPNLEFFMCTGFMKEDFSLENLSSLVGAQLEMRLREKEADESAETYSEMPVEEKEVFAKRMLRLLAAVHNVELLTLSSGFVEVLLQAPGALYLRPPELCNLEILKLDMRFTRGCLRSIAYLLKICPIIRTLILASKESNLADVGDDWEPEFSSMCMSSHLKSVEISEMEGCDNELKFLSCLLKNCMFLRRLTVTFKSTSESLDRRRQIRRFIRNLKVLPTGSSSIDMILCNLRR